MCNMKKLQTIIILLCVIIIGGFAYWLMKDNAIAAEEEEHTSLSPTQIKSIENIGEWEFLSITDQELVDTVRRGFFKDDQLMRIYYGTLALGINTKELKEDWVEVDNDTIVCTLPPIKLLDNNFIDEAKTSVFYESGKWTGKDKQAMYQRAYTAMKGRALRETNIQRAKVNAQTQFYRMLKAMGFTNVKVAFDE